MPAPIIATKLYIPPPRGKVVPRPRLAERLNAGGRLALISAPAGFGKTTLICDWLLSERLAGCKAAWLSLDEDDNDPARFLVYLVSALQTAAANIGAGVLAALESPQPPPTEYLLTNLLNELAAIPGNFILVLDDYHLIDASNAIDEALAFLLEHLPPQMRLVIATREDPRLPLARLRARGQLTELRAADLRFTPAEAAEFLNRVMGLGLSAENVAALEARTEGWIAGLQLAALAMQEGSQRRKDAAGFIQSFTGSRGPGVHRFVLDYLVEEILRQQPLEVREFLLQTSILDRFNAELCEHVIGDWGLGINGPIIPNHQSPITHPLIDYLDRSNLFVVPLDGERRWYRYHHLFAEVLKARLLEEQPGQIPTLHRRASAWYEQNGMPSDAIRHALAGADFERAAGLIELAWAGMDVTYQSAAWLGWAKALPEALVRARPVLSAGYAWALLDGGELEAVEPRLRDAERWLEGPRDGMTVVDEEQFRALPASIASARTYRAMALGDLPGAVLYARQALERAHEDDLIRRIQGTALLGMAEYASGDLEAASRSLAESAAYMRKAGDVAGSTGINFVLAEMKIVAGHLNEAANLYQQALLRQDGPALTGTADLYRGFSELCCERGDLEAASRHLEEGKKLGEQAALPNWRYRLCIAEARIKGIQGDLDGALALLDEAERNYVRSALPEMRPITALKARVWVRQERLGEALEWARAQGLSADDDLSYQREFEHITLARVLIARYQSEQVDGSIDEAVRLLERLRQAAEAGGRIGSLIEILALQALAAQAVAPQERGEMPAALGALERALTLAGPEGYCRVFVDEGRPMAELLARMEEKGATQRVKAYIHRLLAAFGMTNEVPPSSPTKQNAGPRPQAKALQAKAPQAEAAPLIEPLSERELDVLRLLRSEMSGPEIAQELMVSLNTMRTHTKNIFTKLGVNNRRAAVRRAEELGLV